MYQKILTSQFRPGTSFGPKISWLATYYGSDFPPKFYVANLVFVFLSLQFNFVKYVIVACELPDDNSLDQRMLLKN